MVYSQQLELKTAVLWESVHIKADLVIYPMMVSLQDLPAKEMK
jgi:hypothetical protein